MTRLAAALLLLASAALIASSGQDERRFVADHPGRIAVLINHNTNPKATAREGAAFDANLLQLRDALLGGPMFNPPRGVEVSGWLNIDHNPPADARAPIAGTGLIQFYAYVVSRKTGLPVRFIVTTAELTVGVNVPDWGLEALNLPGVTPRLYLEPERAGEAGGFPVYRRGGGDEILVLNAGTKPPWVPVTREEFVNVWLRIWEQRAATTPPVDTLTPKIVASHKSALAAMSPEERRLPARYLVRDPTAPMLAPVGSSEGQALVKANPEWFDPALPRTAFQLISLRFQYAGDLAFEHPESTPNIDVLRVWQMLHKSDWGAIARAVLTRK